MEEASNQVNQKSFLSRAGKFFSGFVFFTGVVALSLIALVVFSLRHEAVPVASPMPQNILLQFNFEAGLVGGASMSFSNIGELFRQKIELQDVIKALDTAAKDTRVKGLVAQIADIDYGMADIEELRAAILRFRAAGKFARVYGTSFGEGGMGDYYLASAFDTVVMQPVGMVMVNGIGVEMPFFKGLFDKIGVDAQFVHQGIYKSAPESFTGTGMSAPSHENMTTLVEGLSAQMVQEISSARKIAPADFAKGMLQSPFSDQEALGLKLVDKLGYADEVIADARKIAALTEAEDNVDLADYLSAVTPQQLLQKDVAAIAVIKGTGEIVSTSPTGGMARDSFAADDIVSYFEDAVHDKNVKAIVFSVDSPGGSPAASETIHRAIVMAKAAGKPVVVSMGNYAASGGYWVATPADKIVADAMTVTGSIGVFGGKFVLEKLWEKLGVNWERVGANENAGMFSPHKSFTPEQITRFDAVMKSTYETFLQRVSSGRKMPIEKVRALAEGRVYTGVQAKQVGLVDDIGDMNVAIKKAAELAKLIPEPEVITFPQEKSPFESFIAMVTGGAFFSPQIKISVQDLKAALFNVPHFVVR